MTDEPAFSISDQARTLAAELEVLFAGMRPEVVYAAIGTAIGAIEASSQRHDLDNVLDLIRTMAEARQAN